MNTLVAQYFLNHRLDLDEIARQMDLLAAAGYEVVEPHARQGLRTPYLSEAWFRAVDVILRKCRQHGMQMWLWDEDYFPSGQAGGRVVWEDPGSICRLLRFSRHRFEGEGPFEADFPEGALLRAVALPVVRGGYGEAIDVTAHCGTRRQRWTDAHVKHKAYSPGLDLAGGPHWRNSMQENRFALCWQPPEAGTYLVVAAVVENRPGPRPDLLSAEAVRRFIEHAHEPYCRRYGEEFGGLITGTFTDEPHPGGNFPWTPGFAEAFRADHGYDLLEQFHHLAVVVDETSPVVRQHYRLTQHRLQSAAYTGQILRWCREKDIQSSGHLTRTEWLSLTAAFWPNELRFYREMDVPATDPLGCRVAVSEAASYHSGLKVVSSAAHLFGKRKCSSDCLAVVGEEATLADLKYMLDYHLVLGVNHFNVHGLSYSIDGPRKDEVPPSLFYQHTQFPHAATLNEHVRTVAEALTDGEHICELAVLYPAASLACQIDDSDRHPYLCDEPKIHEISERLLRRQRDFDFIDEVTLAESVDAEGTLHTSERYRAIVLPHVRYLDEPAAEALVRFARAGGGVLAVGQWPRVLPRGGAKPCETLACEQIRFVEELPEEHIDALPAAAEIESEGFEGCEDIFVCRRKIGENFQWTFLFNRAERDFTGRCNGEEVLVPARSSLLIRHFGPLRDVLTPQLPAAGRDGEGLRWDEHWRIEGEDNCVPLRYWHVEDGTAETPCEPFTVREGFDVMLREADPLGAGNGRGHYHCRFHVEGSIADARLVFDAEALGGDWRVYLNDEPVEGFEPSRDFDCRCVSAAVGGLLRGGSTPAVNVLRVESEGEGRGVRFPLYLYGTFACRWPYSHASLPHLRGEEPERFVPAGGPMDFASLGRVSFSGAVRYRRGLEIAEGCGGDWLLDLGEVRDSARVLLDGREIRTLAWRPFRCLLVNLTAGRHELCVEVRNAPANRARDLRLPAGLLGPVRLRPF
jgi:hypothetical protein